MNITVFSVLPFFSAAIAWLLARLGLNLLIRKLYAQRTALAQQMAAGFSGDLLNAATLSQKITDPEKLAAVKPMIEAHVNTFLNIKLQEKLPVIAMFASPDMLSKIKEGLMEEIDLLLPEVIEQYVARLIPELDAPTLIAQKTEALREAEVKALIENTLKAQSINIPLYAALFGLIIGSVPFVLFLL